MLSERIDKRYFLWFAPLILRMFFSFNFLQSTGARLNVCLLGEPLAAAAAEGAGWLAAGPGRRRWSHHQGDGLNFQPGVCHRGFSHHALHSRTERIQVRKMHTQ